MTAADVALVAATGAALVAVWTAATAVLTAILDPVSPARGGQVVARPLLSLARALSERDRTTPAADGLLGWAGALGIPGVALGMALVVPLAGLPARIGSPVGLVWFNALDVALWALVWLVGWGPNSLLPLVGGYRFLAQALSYELPLMFALTAPAVAAGSLDFAEIESAQRHLWFVVWMPVAFVAFCAAVLGFAFWGPLDRPAGADISGGVLAEAAGTRRLLVESGRYGVLAMGAAAAVVLFLGGGAGPLLPAWVWGTVKTLAVLTGLVAVRGRLPSLPPDRVAPWAWLVVLPAVLLQLLVVSAVVVFEGVPS